METRGFGEFNAYLGFLLFQPAPFLRGLFALHGDLLSPVHTETAQGATSDQPEGAWGDRGMRLFTHRWISASFSSLSSV